MALRLRLRPGLPPLRRGRDAVQLGLSATAGGIVVEGLTPPEVALLERLDGPLGGALRPPELYAAAAELGVPAVNFGPGDPSLAHADDERCPVVHLDVAARLLTEWLS